MHCCGSSTSLHFFLACTLRLGTFSASIRIGGRRAAVKARLAFLLFLAAGAVLITGSHGVCSAGTTALFPGNASFSQRDMLATSRQIPCCCSGADWWAKRSGEGAACLPSSSYAQRETCSRPPAIPGRCSAWQEQCFSLLSAGAEQRWATRSGEGAACLPFLPTRNAGHAHDLSPFLVAVQRGRSSAFPSFRQVQSKGGSLSFLTVRAGHLDTSSDQARSCFGGVRLEGMVGLSSSWRLHRHGSRRLLSCDARGVEFVRGCFREGSGWFGRSRNPFSPLPVFSLLSPLSVFSPSRALPPRCSLALRCLLTRVPPLLAGTSVPADARIDPFSSLSSLPWGRGCSSLPLLPFPLSRSPALRAALPAARWHSWCRLTRATGSPVWGPVATVATGHGRVAPCREVPFLPIEFAWPHGLADALGKDYTFRPCYGVP